MNLDEAVALLAGTDLIPAGSRLDEARRREDLEILTELRDLGFDENGDLVDFEPALAAHAA